MKSSSSSDRRAWHFPQAVHQIFVVRNIRPVKRDSAGAKLAVVRCGTITDEGRNRMSDDREQRVKQRAYELWEQSGRPSGRHDDHWDQARRETEQQDQGRTTEAQAPTVDAAAKRGATKRAPGASARKGSGGTSAPRSRTRSKAEV
jgi:hypothetical protein